MKIAANMAVTMDYTVKTKDGEFVESTEDEGPVAYVHGTGSIVPGLEKALDGKSAGDHVVVSVASDEAYGERDDENTITIEKAKYPDLEGVEVGMTLEAETDEGHQMVTVIAVDDTSITLDVNHPLSGVDLVFDVTIREVREATAEEIEHGHVHGFDDDDDEDCCDE